MTHKKTKKLHKNRQYFVETKSNKETLEDWEMKKKDKSRILATLKT